MPTISFNITQNKLDRIVAAAGGRPADKTDIQVAEWFIKMLLRERVRQEERAMAENAARGGVADLDI